MNLLKVGDAGRLRCGNHQIAGALDARDVAEILEGTIPRVSLRAIIGGADAIRLGNAEIDRAFGKIDRALRKLAVADLGPDHAPGNNAHAVHTGTRVADGDVISGRHDLLHDVGE